MTSLPLVPVRVSSPLVPMRVQPRALFTVVVAVAVLSPGSGSLWAPLTVARPVSVPVARGSTTTVTVVLAPAARVPRAQVAPVAEVVQVPWPGVAETTVAAGPVTVSVRPTPVAAVVVEVLVTVTVWVARSPMLTVPVPVLVTARSTPVGGGAPSPPR